LVVFQIYKDCHYFNANIYGDKIMAQMRVKDQDLVVEQVVSTIESNELEKFKARKDVQDIQEAMNERIGMIKQLHDKYKELEETIKAEQQELKDLVQGFQKANGFEYSSYATKQGVWLDNVSTYGVSIPELKVVWQLPYTTKHEISTKLRLQTMGGDFDVYKLIEELTTEFSS
jgi:uncharacterized protein YktA (UPF0223 family)